MRKHKTTALDKALAAVRQAELDKALVAICGPEALKVARDIRDNHKQD